MPIREIGSPQAPLYRISRPFPTTWPSPSLQGHGRFDDPLHNYAVLYAADSVETGLTEVLAPLRPNLDYVVRLQTEPDGDSGDDLPPAGLVSGDWHRDRVVTTLTLAWGQRWLDLYYGETVIALRQELAPLLVALGLQDFDFSDVLGRERAVTQLISGWAFQQGFSGIAYRSRLADVQGRCWAIFSRAQVVLGAPSPLAADDPAYLSALRFLGLRRADTT